MTMDFFSEYWWDAYLWNIDGMVVWPVWVTLLCIAVVLIFQMVAVIEKRKRNSVLIVMCIVGSLLMPFTGEFSGELAFRQACARDAGLTVFRAVNIPSEYVKSIDSTTDTSIKLYMSKKLGIKIDREYYEKNFSFQ